MDETRTYAFLGDRDRSVLAVAAELARRRRLARALRLHALGAALRGQAAVATADRCLARRLDDPTQLFAAAELGRLGDGLAVLRRGALAIDAAADR